jgi:rhodanese-related sulfurtransferase
MRYLTLALTLVAAFATCSRPKQQLPPVLRKPTALRRLLPQEFAQLLTDTHAFLVNVEPSPTGEIPGTRLLVSGERAFESLLVVQPDVTRPILLYCEKDTPSDTIAARLARAGYASVCFLSGGYRAWIDAGLPFWLFNRNQEH